MAKHQAGYAHSLVGKGVPADILTWQVQKPFRVWVHARQSNDGYKVVGIDFQWMGNGEWETTTSPEEVSLRLQLAALVPFQSDVDVLKASSFRGLSMGSVLDIHSSILVESKLGNEFGKSKQISIVKNYVEKSFDSSWMDAHLRGKRNPNPDTPDLTAKTNDALLIAFVYAQQSEGGTKRPAKRTGELLGIPNDIVYMALRVARRHGWLTSEGAGNSGGRLTESGRQQMLAIKGEAKLKELLN